MSTDVTTGGSAAPCPYDRPARVTRSLLGYGVLAGPLYTASVVIQGLTRPGFDLTRDDTSLLSNGSLGWIQILTFALTGAMVIAFAAGLGRALGEGRASRWAARLVGLYGLGLIGAAVFVADPMEGFPPGTPPGRPVVATWHGTMHIVAAGIGFLGLIAACFVMARHFHSSGRRGWELLSWVTGLAFLAGFLGLASGSESRLALLAFWAALLLVWTWIGAVAVDLYRRVARRGAAELG